MVPDDPIVLSLLLAQNSDLTELLIFGGIVLASLVGSLIKKSKEEQAGKKPPEKGRPVPPPDQRAMPTQPAGATPPERSAAPPVTLSADLPKPTTQHTQPVERSADWPAPAIEARTIDRPAPARRIPPPPPRIIARPSQPTQQQRPTARPTPPARRKSPEQAARRQPLREVDKPIAGDLPELELVAETETSAAEAAPSLAAGRLRELLREPESVRTAIILSEVLGPPVGIRDDHLRFPTGY